jgi:hypothetical protein
MEEAENLISALVDHVDAQLALAFACFLGLGPAEISGLQWGTLMRIGFTSGATNRHTARLARRRQQNAWPCPSH